MPPEGEKKVLDDCRDGNGVTLRTASILGFFILMVFMAVFGIVIGMVTDSDDAATTTTSVTGPCGTP